MSNLKKGDWKCNCGMVNFASRDKCYKCGDFKSKSVGSNHKINSQMRDWDCVDCEEHNFGSRMSCRECHSNRPNQPDLQQPVEANHKPGDWLCQVCKSPEYNFGIRTNCRKCGAEKIAPVIDQNKVEECKICLERPVSVAFTSCGHVVSCDVCCYAMDKCPICRQGYTAEQILKIYVS